MKWVKCSDYLPKSTNDPIIFRKNWNYATAKTLIPISVAQIKGVFNDELKYIEWLDETDDSAEREAFEAGRKIYNGNEGTNSYEYQNFDDYKKSK